MRKHTRNTAQAARRSTLRYTNIKGEPTVTREWAAVVAEAAFAIFALGLGALAVFDVRRHRLPNKIMFPLAGVGLVALTVASVLEHRPGRMIGALGCMAVLLLVFYGITLLGPMGYGDVKLAGVLGLYLGWLGIGVVYEAFVLGALAAALYGIALVAVYRLRGATWKGLSMPYGPFLAGGALLAMLGWAVESYYT